MEGIAPRFTPAAALEDFSSMERLVWGIDNMITIKSSEAAS
jgi:hypothetical protein